MPGQAHVGREAPDRIGRIERVVVDLNDDGVAGRLGVGGKPRGVRFDREDDVRLADEGPGVEALVQRMIPREVEMGRPGLDHRQPQAVGEMDERLWRRRVPSQRRGDRQRVGRRRKRLRGLAQRGGGRLGRTGRPEAGGRAEER